MLRGRVVLRGIVARSKLRRDRIPSVLRWWRCFIYKRALLCINNPSIACSF